MPKKFDLYTVRKDPLIQLRGYPAESRKLKEATFTEIVVGIGKIAVHEENSPLSPTVTYQAILASLGMENADIGRVMGVARSTVKSNLSYGWAKVSSRQFDRTLLARLFFDSGTYKVAKLGEPLALTPRQLPIVDAFSRGETRSSAADINHISPNTASSYAYNIHGQSGWSGQQEIVLAAILSGELGDYAAEALEARAQKQQNATIDFSTS